MGAECEIRSIRQGLRANLILPVRIGIWSEEQGVTQRVRFTVELSVTPGGHRPGDLSSVVSYDDIIGGIKDPSRRAMFC